MDTLAVKRQQLIAAIETLPPESLLELVNFVEYLRYKTTRVRSMVESETISPPTPAEILSAIAALPIEADKNEFSGRDHDKVLYSQP